MLVQVAGALFAQIEVHAKQCLAQEGSEHVPEFGFRYEVGLEPVPVNLRRMVDSFERGILEFDSIYARLPTPRPAPDSRPRGPVARRLHHAGGLMGPHGV
jgi:hypothetical protein